MESLPFRRNDRSHLPHRAHVAIRVESHYKASPQRVFDAWLDPDIARRWLFATATRPIAHVEIDARVAGRFRFVEQPETGDVEHRGEYAELAPHRRLVFTLALAGRRRSGTRVIVEIESRARGCDLALTHEDLPLDLAHAMEARWTGILYGLGVTLDSNRSESAIERLQFARRGPLRRPPLGEGRLP